jgi:hypothetical protein
MNKFDAGLFVNIGSSLQWFSRLTKTGEWNERTRKSGEEFSQKIAADLRTIGCEISAQAAIRFGNELPDKFGIRPVTDLEPRARELQSVIFSEMRRHLFLWVPPERARYYQLPQSPRGFDDNEKAIEGIVLERFANARNEIISARKAYALGQWTACVFHLMRACETGIKAIYKTLNMASPKLSDSWGNLLKPMDEQLQKKPSDRHGEWAKHSEFFDHATNDLRSIKRAWRDPTMHIEANYDESGARKALDAVISFFIHLSQHLDQDGNVF